MMTGNLRSPGWAASRAGGMGRLDVLAGLAVGASALGVYLRTLAPGLLYGDSAEFQTLAATLGVAHPSGYAPYLLLAKVFTWLPVGTIAWRVNLLSAVMGALALVGIYWMVRQLTGSRTGALLGALLLGIGRTFWSQAVIAEVYTTAALALVGVVCLLYAWHLDPARRAAHLFFASLLVGLSLHITLVVMAPALGAFVCCRLAQARLPARQWRGAFLAAISGALAGLALFLLATLALVLHNPPTSYVQVTLLPSHSAWDVAAASLDSPLEQLTATVFGVQWQRSLFSGDLPFMLGELKYYLKFMLKYDLSGWVFPLAAWGLIEILRRRAAWGMFLLLYGGTLLFLIVNYKGPGKFVFFLSTYALIVIAAGAGFGGLWERLRGILAARLPRSGWVVGALLAVFIAGVLVAPFWSARGQALQAGAATFVTKDDTYPLHDLGEPQALAEMRLEAVEDNAVLLLDWKTLYATYYLAQVEGRKPGVRILEDILDREGGQLAQSLVEELQEVLQAGLPVYSDRPYPALEDTFRFDPLPGSDLVRLRLRFE